mmetsp:Transcript_7354/g.11525  ORF Transcript_7354/g.11525 Transcript_7354/m.11525 type:complete len:96 (+) Transcript_7354:1693-1980(+)
MTDEQPHHRRHMYLLSNEISEIGFSKFATNVGRLNEFFVVSHAKLLKPIVLQRVFLNEEAVNELYVAQRKNLAMALPSFDEFFKVRHFQQKYCFF